MRKISTFFSAHRIATIALIALVFTSLALPVQALPLLQTMAGGTVNWANAPTVITNTQRHNFPWVAVDSNNKTHVVYIQSAMGTTAGPPWEIRYANNVSGNFSYPGTLIDTITGTPAAPTFIIEAGPNNVLHMLYILTSKDDNVYYRQSTDNGANWSAPQTIESAGKSAVPAMAIDEQGNAHITWINNACGKYNVYYRMRSAGGALGSITKPRDDCNTFQNRPQIAIANGEPVIAFQHNDSVNAEVYFARLSGGTWTTTNVSSTSGQASQNTAITANGNNIMIAWDENVPVSSSTSNHEIYFRASEDGGQTWSNSIRLTTNDSLSSYPYFEWSDATRRAYLTWHEQSGSNAHVWLTEYNPETRTLTPSYQVTNLDRASTHPKIAFGSSRADLVWQNNSINNIYQIFDLSGELLGTGGCNGSAVLGGGQQMVNTNNVSAQITPNCSGGGDPEQMQISVGAPPASTSDPAPQAYSATPTITIPSSTVDCKSTVYFRLFKNGNPGEVFNASITVDTAVHANVVISNPYLEGLPPIYNNERRAGVITPSDSYESGAADGHPGYTRVRKFYFGLEDNNDCSGLENFYIPNSDLISPKAIPSSGINNSPALPGTGEPGPKQITAVVTDTLGNSQSFDTTLIYDPDRPSLLSGSVSVDNRTQSVFRTLSFSDVQVDDDIYGLEEDLPSGRRFWGVWIAVNHIDVTGVVTPDNPGLNWLPAEISDPQSSFDITWNLFTGLNYGDDENRPGQYQIFVRFLDGAGNPTAGTLATTATLNSGYTMPKIYLPQVQMRN